MASWLSKLKSGRAAISELSGCRAVSWPLLVLFTPSTEAREVMTNKSMKRYCVSDRLEYTSYRIITDTNWVME